jgi:dimethylargininase
MKTVFPKSSALGFVDCCYTAFAGYEFIRTLAEESNAANCVRVNDRVLEAAANPRLTAELVEHGFNPLVLNISEFQKMDGGLSCRSLRF